MTTIHELRKIRLKKLEQIKKSGITVFPAKTKRTHNIAEALLRFISLSRVKKEVVLAGRIRSLREHGGSTFCHIEDGSGSIQVFFRKNKIGEKGYKFFLDHFDIGDFIEIKGILLKTKRGEKTIEVSDFKILAKSLIPLPEKWHGLQDTEERLRKRYLDILFNPEVKEMVEKRAVFWNSIREFMTKKGFLEVETPVLEITPGGADAKPFKTHHNALDLEVYLRISTGELWQKRLMIAGFEKTFEIGRQFRNEGMDAEHLQDYTQMEFYWAYADYEMGMKLVEELYKYIIKKTFKTLKFKIHPHNKRVQILSNGVERVDARYGVGVKEFSVDFGKKWEKYDYRTVINKYAKIDVFEASLPEMEKRLQKLGVEYDKKGFNRTRAIDNLLKYCRKKLIGPGFLIGTPIEVSPLAKRSEKNPKIAQRFQVIIAGSEVGNGYSELNDPIDQAERFLQQQKLREKGDLEAQMFDKDFVEAMEYGMPPTFGFGIGGERLFAFLMNKSARECQIFPLMRPK